MSALVLTMFTLARPDKMKLAWCVFLVIIWGVFLIDFHHLKRHKQLEFKMYEYKKEQARKKEELAQLRGESLPESEIRLPLIFYLSASVYNIIGIIFLFLQY